MNKTRILVIRSSAMGDVAMTVPVLRALEARYGDSVEVVMLTRDFYEPFFAGISNLSLYDIDLYDRHSGINGIRKLYNELRRDYKFDIIVDLNYKLFSRLLRRFFTFGGTPAFYIDKGRKEKKELTQAKNKKFTQLETSIERYVDVFRAAGFPLDVPNVLPARVFAAPADKKERWIGISPFAKHKGKMLPLQTIREVIEGLQSWDSNLKIFIFGGGREERMAADSLASWYSCCESVIGKMRLDAEMEKMGQIGVMLSMDSSAMHICSLVGTPVVSVWGATHPYAGFLGIGQSENDVVQVDLECRPCSVYGHKACLRGDYACLGLITAGQIIEKLKRHL